MDTRELYSIEEARFMLGGISRATHMQQPFKITACDLEAVDVRHVLAGDKRYSR